MDAETTRIPVIEVIRVVGGYDSTDSAKKAWSRISKDDSDLLAEVGRPCQINGSGQSVVCATPDVITQIIWSLPSKLAKAYRRQCAQIVTRFQMGDQRLHAEIDNNKTATDANGGLPQFTAVEVDAQGREILGPLGKRKLELVDVDIDERRVEVEARRVEIEARRVEIAAQMAEIEARKKEIQAAAITNATNTVDLFERMGMLCDRNKFAIIDSVMNNLGEQRAICAAPTQGAIQEATQDNTIDASDGARGHKQVYEIMQHDLGLPPDVIRRHSSKAGKAAAAAYRHKYGEGVDFSKVKRYVDNAARPVNMYPPEDIPMITEAIRDYLANKGV